jgi:hypothetical protein
MQYSINRRKLDRGWFEISGQSHTTSLIQIVNSAPLLYFAVTRS